MRRPLKIFFICGPLCLVMLAVICWFSPFRSKLTNPILSSIIRRFEPPLFSEALLAQGKPLLILDDGDYVHPSISPDGRLLAYARVIVEGEFEGTEILIYDLKTDEITTLLEQEEAKEFACYKVFALRMEWLDEERLEVSLGDGDVGETRIIFNIKTGEKLDIQYIDHDDPDLFPGSDPAHQAAFATLKKANFNVRPEVMDSATVYNLSGDLILQKNYHQEDEHIWLFDSKNKDFRVILEDPEGNQGLRGAADAGRGIVFVIAIAEECRFYIHRNNETRLAGILPMRLYAFMKIKHRMPGKSALLIQAHASYERGDNPLVVFDGKRLRRIVDYRELYDVGFASQIRDKVAFCYWEKNERHIAVRSLAGWYTPENNRY